MSRQWFAGMLLALSATTAVAEDEYRHGRIRYLEDGVTLQRASEPSAEEATPNLPFLPGDRLWTDGGGRVEFQFAGGSLLRLDNRSKLDYTAHEEGRIFLRLWSGGAFLRTRDSRADEFEFETPGGIVFTQGAGLIRVDVDAGETRLAVLEGEATIESGRRQMRVSAGQRAYGRRGEAPSEDGYARYAEDDFDRWNESRDERGARAANSQRYLPDEVSPYADELDAHGSWYYETEVGYVWRPVVGAGWRPYTSGRWCWTSFGWTWVPNEPWGWAPFHYGRWGHSTAIGWYWIPGQTWGPAWVSWALGGDYVGWCPLGYRDRVYSFDNRQRGNAVPRGSGGESWVFARRADMSARDLAHRRASVRPEEVPGLRVADSPHARPARDLVTIETRPARETTQMRAVPRTVQTRPTPGDTVPELRSDNMTTIPAPVARRRSTRDEDDRDRDRQDRRFETDSNRSAPSDAAAARSPRRNSPDEAGQMTTRARPAESSGGDSARTPAARAPERERSTERERTERSTPRDRETSRERPRTESEDRSHPSQEIMRNFFSPLNPSRSRGEDGQSARPRSEGASSRGEARSEPRRDEPRRETTRDDSRSTSRSAPPPRVETARPAAPPPAAAERATRRAKDKDKQ